MIESIFEYYIPTDKVLIIYNSERGDVDRTDKITEITTTTFDSSEPIVLYWNGLEFIEGTDYDVIDDNTIHLRFVLDIRDSILIIQDNSDTLRDTLLLSTRYKRRSPTTTLTVLPYDTGEMIMFMYNGILMRNILDYNKVNSTTITTNFTVLPKDDIYIFIQR